MKKVKVRRDELLETIRTNRTKHVADFEEARVEYRAAAIRLVEEKMAEAGKLISKLDGGEDIPLPPVYFELEPPRSYEKDYNQVIKMLEMSVDQEIELSADEFSCYVMDDWGWKADFYSNKMSYSSVR